MIQHFPMVTETLKTKSCSETIAVWAITPNGTALARKIHTAIKDSILFVSMKMAALDNNDKTIVLFEKLSREIHLQFNRFSGHVFIFSTGIVVRILAPLLKSKISDPAVVVVDEAGTHAISLLSGHIGGANALAKKIAVLIDAVPVITTATDTNHLPSIDLIAKDNGLYIETPWNIKQINMSILQKKPLDVYDPLGIVINALPASLLAMNTDTGMAAEKVFCSHELKPVSRETLILRPRVLSAGIGCNRGTSCREIETFLAWVFEKEGLSINSLFRLATSVIKEDEEGLRAFSKKMNLPIDFYTKEDLNSVTTIQTPSKMVEKHLGVKSVCEAAAILSADNGKLIVPKNKNKDVTVAVAIKK